MILYLDTSSLVKLYVEEEGSEQVALLVKSASYCATSIVAYAARAAFAGRSREQAFSLEDFQHIKLALEKDWSRYVVLTLVFSLVAQAGELAEKHPLKGGRLHPSCFRDQFA